MKCMIKVHLFRQKYLTIAFCFFQQRVVSKLIIPTCEINLELNKYYYYKKLQLLQRFKNVYRHRDPRLSG